MTIKPPHDVMTHYRSLTYSMGGSRGLAYEIQNLTGWQLAGIRVSLQDKSQTVIDHIGVRTPSGLFLDSRGLQNQAEFLSVVEEDNIIKEIEYISRAESDTLPMIEDNPQDFTKRIAHNLVIWAFSHEAGLPRPPQPLDTIPFPNGKTVTLDQQGFVTGEVLVELHEVTNMDLERLLDTLSTRLSGSELLMDVSYKPVRVEGGSLIIEVSGDPSQIFECHYGPYGEEDSYPPKL